MTRIHEQRRGAGLVHTYRNQALSVALILTGGIALSLLGFFAIGHYHIPVFYSAWLVLGAGLLITMLLAWYVRTLQCYGDKLRRLNRRHEIRSHSYRNLVQALDEQELLDAFCRVLVEVANYRFAWIGYTEPDPANTPTSSKPAPDTRCHATTSVRVMARAGTMASSDDAPAMVCYGNHEQPSTCTAAIQSGQPQILTDIEDPNRRLLWRSEAIRHGYRSMIALPLSAEKHAFGNVNLFAADPNPFDSKEVRLLQDLVTDLALGIITLRTREADKQQLRHLREQVEQEERQHLAATLHDGVGQSVQAVNLGLKRLRTLTDPALTSVTKLLDTVIDEQATIIRDLRDISHELRPLFTRNWDLREAIRQQCQDLSERSTLPIELHIGEQPCLMPQRMQEQCFLIVREALSNAIKHSQASHIDVSLTHRDHGFLCLTIQDDGIGFDPDGDFHHPAGLGLSMMVERALSIGGHTYIESTGSNGTLITILLPVAETSAPPHLAQAPILHTNTQQS